MTGYQQLPFYNIRKSKKERLEERRRHVLRINIHQQMKNVLGRKIRRNNKKDEVCT